MDQFPYCAHNATIDLGSQSCLYMSKVTIPLWTETIWKISIGGLPYWLKTPIKTAELYILKTPLFIHLLTLYPLAGSSGPYIKTNRIKTSNHSHSHIMYGHLVHLFTHYLDLDTRKTGNLDPGLPCCENRCATPSHAVDSDALCRFWLRRVNSLAL